MCVLKEVKRGVFFLFFFFFSCVCLKMEWEHRSFLHFFCVFLDRLSRSNISNEIDLGFAWIDVVLSIFIIIMRSCDSGYSGTLEMFCLRTRRFESCRTRFCPWRTGKSETNKMRCFRPRDHTGQDTWWRICKNYKMSTKCLQNVYRYKT